MQNSNGSMQLLGLCGPMLSSHEVILGGKLIHVVMPSDDYRLIVFSFSLFAAAHKLCIFYFFHDHFQFLLRTIGLQWLVTMSIGGGSEDPCGRGRPCATNSLNGPSFILSPLFRYIQKINECTGGPGSAKQKLR